MKIRNFVHKGVKRLYEEDKAKSVPPDTVDKLRKMLAYLDDMESPKELRALPAWKVHTLTGDRKGIWSLNVTRNWASDLPHRQRGAPNLRREFRRLPPGQKEKAPCP